MNIMPILYRDPMSALFVGGGMAAGGMAGSALSGRDKVKNDWLQNPEYPENTAARELWWKRLQEWGNDPYYGGISPDWNNIWETTQRRVKEYYDGGPLAPGMKDRIKSSLARRGVSESPASEALLARTDAEQGNRLADLATEQGIQKAQFGENARNLWLNSLQELESRKPQGQWQTQIIPNQGRQFFNSLTGVGSSIAGYGMSGMQNQQSLSWLERMNRQNNRSVTDPQTFARGLIYGSSN